MMITILIMITIMIVMLPPSAEKMRAHMQGELYRRLEKESKGPGKLIRIFHKHDIIIVLI